MALYDGGSKGSIHLELKPTSSKTENNWYERMLLPTVVMFELVPLHRNNQEIRASTTMVSI